MFRGCFKLHASSSLPSSFFHRLCCRETVMKGTKANNTPSKKINNKSVAKRKADSKNEGKKQTKKEKPSKKDSGAPKRPAGPFFIFMEEFRKTYKEQHPDNNSVAEVGKAGGSKWKSMLDSEKAPYVAKAEKRKAEYEKLLAAYTYKQSGGEAEPEPEESDKSKSEVNDEDGSGEGGER